MKIATIVFAFALLASACTTTTTRTSTTSPTDAGDDDGASRTKGATSSAKDAGSSNDDQDAETSDSTCGATADNGLCFACCAGEHPTAGAVYQAGILECICETNCKTECSSTLCGGAPTNPDATCSSCIGAQADKCAAEAARECEADTDCAAWSKCLIESGCDKKK